MHRQLLITSCCMLLVASSFEAASEAGTSRAGAWQRSQAVLRLAGMPLRYSCRGLERKVLDVFGLAGARDVSVHATRCESALGSAYSPQVRWHFDFPQATSKWRTVRIEPGQPSSLEAADCALMRRLRPFLPGVVTRYRLACRAPQFREPAFYVELRVPSAATAAAHPM